MGSRFLFRITTSSSWKISRAAAVSKHCLKNVFNQFPQRCIHKTSFDRRRWYSQEVTEMAVVDFDYVKKATNNGKVLIVDVREPEEIKEHGKIPNSINIPLGSISTVLSQTSDEEFEQTYQRAKPSEDTEIIFYCMIGKRSGMAQENAKKIGFRNVKNYLGSFKDWAVKINE